MKNFLFARRHSRADIWSTAIMAAGVVVAFHDFFLGAVIGILGFCLFAVDAFFDPLIDEEDDVDPMAAIFDQPIAPIPDDFFRVISSGKGPDTFN